MLLQNGEWYIPDRLMGEFTNEEAGQVNRKASERNKIELISAQNTQVIDFTCHLKVINTKGHASKLYSRESAIALLNVTTNFTRDWTREKAIAAVNESFDWVEAHADTNPARLLYKQNEIELLSAKNTQVIDFTCDLKIRDVRGKPSKLYSREAAISVKGEGSSLKNDKNPNFWVF